MTKVVALAEQGEELVLEVIEDPVKFCVLLYVGVLVGGEHRGVGDAVGLDEQLLRGGQFQQRTEGDGRVALLFVPCALVEERTAVIGIEVKFLLAYLLAVQDHGILVSDFTDIEHQRKR